MVQTASFWQFSVINIGVFVYLFTVFYGVKNIPQICIVTFQCQCPALAQIVSLETLYHISICKFLLILH